MITNFLIFIDSNNTILFIQSRSTATISILQSFSTDDEDRVKLSLIRIDDRCLVCLLGQSTIESLHTYMLV